MEPKDYDLYDYFLTLDYSYEDAMMGNKIKIQKNRYRKTDEEILEEMDFKVVEAFVRRKKLEKIAK